MGAPVKHTCPDIDALISSLKDACTNCENAINYIDNEKLEDAKAELKDAIWFLEDFRGKRNTLEELRDANDALRSWGYDLEKQVEALEMEVATNGN